MTPEDKQQKLEFLRKFSDPKLNDKDKKKLLKKVEEDNKKTLRTQAKEAKDKKKGSFERLASISTLTRTSSERIKSEDKPKTSKSISTS